MGEVFPHFYDVSLTWKGEDYGVLEVPSHLKLTGGPPPQFDGSDSWWSPEHLLLASVGLSLMTTFLKLASKTHLPLKGYHCWTDGILEKTSQGDAFSSIIEHIMLDVDEKEGERAARLLLASKEYCVITNSLKTPVILEVSVRTPAEAV